ncbi:hypothetical protein L1987_12534 [Smallanthus sonchifolius]|uniref:Uncharacterized protein n=1 Tax=Smallanthus sonchifolius TaxID=185202 RepID=A0ACB9JGC9_9ASTR|nr:hypothetical protein L1987_12534 [Smallanthus sonchifolius]
MPAFRVVTVLYATSASWEIKANLENPEFAAPNFGERESDLNRILANSLFNSAILSTIVRFQYHKGDC